MFLKFVKGGSVHRIPLSNSPPNGKRAAIRHNNSNYYAPLVPYDDAVASKLSFVFDGGNYALATSFEHHYSLFYSDGSADTLPVTNPLNMTGFNNLQHAWASNGGTIISNSTGASLGGKNVSLIGGSGNDTFIFRGGNTTINNFSAGDIISVSSFAPLNLNQFSVNGSDVIIGDPSSNSLYILDGNNQICTILTANGNSNVFDFGLDSDGVLSSNRNSITLKSGHGDFDASSNDNFDQLITIVADKVAAGAVIKARTNKSSYLTAGYNPNSITLVGGNLGDTLNNGFGNNKLTGGSGADIFIYNGNHCTISDYSYSQNDKVSLTSHTPLDITGVSVDNNGITIDFGDQTNQLVLEDANANSTIKFATTRDSAGTDYCFENNMIKQANNRGVTLTSDYNNSYTISVDSQQSVIAHDSATIQSGSVTSHGYFVGGKNVSVKGGDSTDTFVYSGGNMSISGYAASDRISLLSGYSVKDSKITDSSTTITIKGSDDLDVGTINIDSTLASFKLYKGGSETTMYVGADPNYSFNNSIPANAGVVTLNCNFGDFGGTTSLGGDSVRGTEYYKNLYTIVSAQENSTIVGNNKANTIKIAGGRKNFLTGGLGNDVFIFEAGGGIITDFGVGANKTKAGTSLTTNTTVASFNRFDSGTYSEGADVLRFSGTVNGIFYDTDSDDSTDIASFDVVITYADSISGDQVILLKDVNKKYDTTVKAYSSNTDAVNTIRVWDYRSGNSATLSADTKSAVTHDFDSFPVSLRGSLVNLYRMYNSSRFSNSYPTDGDKLQVLPSWVPVREV